MIDIVGTVEHAVMFARQQAITKRITIEFEVRDALPPVEHDPAQINQVLLNLLLNAIQSMDKPGVIRVTLEQDDDVLSLPCLTKAKASLRSICPTSSVPSSRPRDTVLDWACRSLAAWWNHTAGRLQSAAKWAPELSLKSGCQSRVLRFKSPRYPGPFEPCLVLLIAENQACDRMGMNTDNHSIKIF